MPTSSIITYNQEASNLYLQILNLIMLQLSQPTISYLAFYLTIFLSKLFCPKRNITISLEHIKFPHLVPLKIHVIPPAQKPTILIVLEHYRPFPGFRFAQAVSSSLSNNSQTAPLQRGLFRQPMIFHVVLYFFHTLTVQPHLQICSLINRVYSLLDNELFQGQDFMSLGHLLNHQQ